MLAQIISADLRSAAPVLVTALGLLCCQNAGVVNIGAEGMMLAGAFAAAAASYYLHNSYAALALAIVAGALFALLFALLTVKFGADEIIVGAGINMLVPGITTVLARLVFGMSNTLPQLASFKPIRFGRFSDNAAASFSIIFEQTALVYLALLLVPVTHYIMHRTKAGLVLRATGVNPQAAASIGINIKKVKVASILTSGAAAGAGGAFLSLGTLSFFVEGMTGGRGFIALAAVAFSKGRCLGTALAALIFSLGLALEPRLQAAFSATAAGNNTPYQLFMMAPYLLTLLSLCLQGISRAPGALEKNGNKKNA
jgi:simple sugar transport system permease protein